MKSYSAGQSEARWHLALFIYYGQRSAIERQRILRQRNVQAGGEGVQASNIWAERAHIKSSREVARSMSGRREATASIVAK